MTMQIRAPLRAALAGVALTALSVLPAAAASLPVSADLQINASVGNTVTSTVFPLTTTLTGIGAGEEYTFSSQDLITYTSSGFPQTMSGTVGVDISDGQVVLRFSGTAQGVGLSFSLTNIDFGTPSMDIDSASQSGATGIISGVNATQAVGFTSNSIAGGFNFFGFQPGTSVTQTISFTTKASPGGTGAVPLPAGIPLLLTGFGVLAMLRRKTTAG